MKAPSLIFWEPSSIITENAAKKTTNQKFFLSEVLFFVIEPKIENIVKVEISEMASVTTKKAALNTM